MLLLSISATSVIVSCIDSPKLSWTVCPLLCSTPLVVEPHRNQAYLISFPVPVPDAKTRAWPLTVDGEALEKILPQLEKAEQEMMLQEEKARAEEKERLKKGEPEDMTVRLLREVLDELNVT